MIDAYLYTLAEQETENNQFVRESLLKAKVIAMGNEKALIPSYIGLRVDHVKVLRLLL